MNRNLHPPCPRESLPSSTISILPSLTVLHQRLVSISQPNLHLQAHLNPIPCPYHCPSTHADTQYAHTKVLHVSQQLLGRYPTSRHFIHTFPTPHSASVFPSISGFPKPNTNRCICGGKLYAAWICSLGVAEVTEKVTGRSWKLFIKIWNGGVGLVVESGGWVADIVVGEGLGEVV
jgi:hypothetical protein